MNPLQIPAETETHDSLSEESVKIVDKEMPDEEKSQQSSEPFAKRFFDWLHDARGNVAHRIIFYSLYICGRAMTLEQVKKATRDTEPVLPPILADVQDADTVLRAAETSLMEAKERRDAIADKCKTLLTVSSLFLAVSGALLTKALAEGTLFAKLLSGLSVILFLLAIVLLLVFFSVRPAMEMSIDHEEAKMDSRALKIRLAESNLQCWEDTNRRNDYLVELFLLVRFYVFGAILVASTVFFVIYGHGQSTRQNKALVDALRGDSELTDRLRGPAGKPGQQGDKGPRGKDGIDHTVPPERIADEVIKILEKQGRIKKLPSH